MNIKLYRKSIVPENSSRTRRTCNFYNTTRRALLCSRLVGLLPLSGLSNETSDKLKCNLRSPYAIFYMFSLFGQILMLLTTLNHVYQKGLSSDSISRVFLYLSSLVSLLILTNTASYWPMLIKSVGDIENKLPTLGKRFNITITLAMAFVAVAALTEEILFIMYRLGATYSCYRDNIAENYIRLNRPWIFQYTSFSMWKGALCEIFTLQSLFLWSYNDLFIILISLYLTEYFLIHNERLKQAVLEEQFLCTKFRTEYLRIVHLVKLINLRLGTLLMTSITTNVYWICRQLYYVLNYSGPLISCKDNNSSISDDIITYGVSHTVYFTYSFSFLVTRASLVLFLAARIHSSATAPLYILYDLPSSKFSVEVQRYISQIKNIETAMSGLGFFHVTRGMILTLVGTIATYELVLLQFSK